jgi:hypothetical protein
MATGFPSITGDILTAAMFNGLITFTVDADATVDYTAVLDDQYQTLVPMNKATAVAFKIPTNASVAFPVGTAITVLNKGVGAVTISATTPASRNTIHVLYWYKISCFTSRVQRQPLEAGIEAVLRLC